MANVTNQRSKHADVKCSISRRQGGGWAEQVPQPHRPFCELVLNDCGTQSSPLSVPGPSQRPGLASGVCFHRQSPLGASVDKGCGAGLSADGTATCPGVAGSPTPPASSTLALAYPLLWLWGTEQRSWDTGRLRLSPACTGSSGSPEVLVTWGRPEGGGRERGHNRTGTQATAAVSPGFTTD